MCLRCLQCLQYIYIDDIDDILDHRVRFCFSERRVDRMGMGKRKDERRIGKNVRIWNMRTKCVVAEVNESCVGPTGPTGPT